MTAITASVERLRLPGLDATGWQLVARGDGWVNALADRHYSRRRPGVGRVAGPGPALVLMTGDDRAAWVSTFPRYNADGLTVWRCSIFRNEGPELSSDLIVAAMAITAEAWGDCPGWATWVDTTKVRSTNPGYCFKMAGWRLDRTYRPDRRRRTLIRLVAP